MATVSLAVAARPACHGLYETWLAGRWSESWTEARLASTEAPLPRMDRVVPCDSVTEPGPDWEQVALLSPVSPSEYIAWRQKVLAEALSKVKPMDSEKSKQTSAERKK